MTHAKQKSTPVPTLSEGALTILSVAKQLFADKGFDAVSMNDIAHRSRVSKANIFHHFGSKEALYLAVLKAACEETVGSLADAQSADSSVAVDNLWKFFASHLTAMLKNPDSVRLILREIAESDASREQALANQVFAEYFSRLVRMVSEGQVQGLLRPDFDPALLAFLMLGANIFFFENRSVTAHLAEGGFVAKPAGYSRDVFDLLLRGALSDTMENSSKDPDMPRIRHE